jgi:hypothetical protein
MIEAALLLASFSVGLKGLGEKYIREPICVARGVDKPT